MGAEQALWDAVTPEVMSDEEQNDGFFEVKSPPWRAMELSDLIEELNN